MIRFVICSVLFCSTAAFCQPPQQSTFVRSLVGQVSVERIRANVATLAGFGTRHTLSDTVSSKRGIGAARRWIASEFARYAAGAGRSVSVGFHATLVPPSGRVPSPANVVNVVARLPSRTLPERLIVVGAHYDSRATDPMDSESDAPGANDDASGIAVLLELARIMAYYEFEATVVFIAFAGEEQGLLGARSWAEMAAQRGWNVVAMFNNDIVGSSVGGDGTVDRGSVRLFSEAFSPLDTGAAFRSRNSLGLESDGGSRTLARWTEETAAPYAGGFDVRLIFRRDRFLRGGDHSAFHDKGFPAVRFSVARENYDWQHQDVRIEDGREYGDVPKFMDMEYCAQVARVNLAAVATLALAPPAPDGAGIVTARLEYQTTLRWNANRDHDLAGYYVRLRETTSPVWQQRRFTTDTTLTLDVLKDDYLFGVQAVDRDGHAGLPAIPRPVR